MPAADPHPSTAQLQAFAVGVLDDAAARDIESHLVECPGCLAVAAAAPDDTLITLLRSAETSHAGPITPQPAFAETMGLPQADTAVNPVQGPPELANHPRYRLVRPLGRGGMGHVWLAEHTVMGRPVALKLIRPEFLDKPAAVERFRREVRAAARLNHANIVAAHDAEQAGGTHFLVMEYIDGETLHERLDAGPIAVPDACQWVIDAARGLDHARASGLIHRDVKPHNLIRDRRTGQVKVLDFGLAGVTAGEVSGLTGGNMVIGTPDYIAPEQAEDARTADTRSDVYALGCTLYHLLAGRPPFPGESVLKKLDAHRTMEPEPLTSVRPDVPTGLATVVARMMAKDPAQRYQTPAEAAEALAPLADPGRAGGASARREPLRSLAPPARRRRAIALTGGLAACLAILAGGVVYRIQTNRGEIVIDAQSPDVEIVLLKDGKEIQVIDTKTNKKVTLPIGEYDLALKTGPGTPDGLTIATNKIEVRRGEETLVAIQTVARRPTEPPAPVVLRGKPDAPWTDLVPFVDVEADRENGLLVRETHDGQPVLRVKDIKDTGRFARVRLPLRPAGDYEIKARIARVEGTDSFNLMLPIPSSGGRTQVGVVIDGFPERGGVTGLEWRGGPSLNMDKTFGGRIVNGRVYELVARVTDKDGRVTIGIELDGKGLLNWTGGVWDARSGVNFFTNDRRYIGFGACSGAFRVERFDVRMLSGTGELIRPNAGGPARSRPEKPGLIGRLERYNGAVTGIVLTPDGTHVYISDAGVSKWNVGTKELVWDNSESGGGIVALSGDGQVLTAWGQDGFARVLDPANGQLVRNFKIPSAPVNHAILNKDGSRAFVSTRGEEPKVKPAIRAWDVVEGKELFPLTGHTDDTYGIALSPDGARVATASYDHTVRLWDATNGKEQHLFRGHTAGVSAIAFSPDGKYLATGGGDQTVRVWDVEEKRGASALLGHTVWITDVAFTPDGARVVSASGYEAKGDGMRVWDWRTGDQLHHFADARGQLTSIAVTPDGGRAISGGGDGSLRLWRLPGPTPPAPERVGPVRRFGRFKGTVTAVSLSKDGAFVYSLDEGVIKWDRATEKVVWVRELGVEGSYHVAATSDDQFVLAGCRDGSVRVLDAKTGEERRRFTKHREQIVGLAVSPDGKRAVSSSGNDEKGRGRSIRVWEVDTGKQLFELKGHTDGSWCVVYSADGARIATASDDGTVRLWDAANGNELHVFRGHKGAASAVAFSPDGKRLVSGGQDLYIRVWDIEKKAQIYALEGHDAWVTDIACTPDGTRILSVGGNFDQEASDGLRVWDAATGKALYEGVRSGAQAVGVVAAPDNCYAVTGSGDGAIRVWRLPDAPNADRR